MITRRAASLGLSAAFASLALGGCGTSSGAALSRRAPWPALEPDPAGVLDLPQGFTYRVISSFGETMADGWMVPDRGDGMGAFDLGGGRVALVRNHELGPGHSDTGPFARKPSGAIPTYDRRRSDAAPLPGGTTTIVYDYRRGVVQEQYLSLVGTIRNCAGGVTPWGSWLTCEEDMTRAGDSVGADHGWVFEVPAAGRGLVQPVALTALGRFNHEAAVVDPRTGIVYLTEDRPDGLLYRLLPNARGRLVAGGRLQALAFVDPARRDTRNWTGSDVPQRAALPVRWIDLDGTHSPADDLRQRGAAAGAVPFARGEGIHMGPRGEIYLACTSGGAARVGQIFRYAPSHVEGHDERASPPTLELFVESSGTDMLHYADNLTVAPSGHLVVCEDQPGDSVDNRLKLVNPSGQISDFARLRLPTELAGACFSPDARTLFVNIYSPTKTVAITGPWPWLRG